MKVGGKARLTCPADIAARLARAGGGLIPPNATLVFEVEPAGHRGDDGGRGRYGARAAAPVVTEAAAPVEGVGAGAGRDVADGAAFRLDAQRGKVVVVNLWATWCAPAGPRWRPSTPTIASTATTALCSSRSWTARRTGAAVRQVMQTLAFPRRWCRDASMKGYGRVWRR